MKKLVLIVSFLFSTQVLANFACDGLVTVAGIGKDTHLYVNNGYGVHKLCSVETDSYCNSWLSLALSAQAQKRPFSVSHTHPTEVSSTACSAIGNWVSSEYGAYYASIPNN